MMLKQLVGCVRGRDNKGSKNELAEEDRRVRTELSRRSGEKEKGVRVSRKRQPAATVLIGNGPERRRRSRGASLSLAASGSGSSDIDRQQVSEQHVQRSHDNSPNSEFGKHRLDSPPIDYSA
ncbi:uncharacterized protein V6R79_026208 [Siganus canaliculatus]